MGNIEQTKQLADQVAQINDRAQKRKVIEQAAGTTTERFAILDEITKELDRAKKGNVISESERNLQSLKTAIEEINGVTGTVVGGAATAIDVGAAAVGGVADVTSMAANETANTLQKNADAVDVFRQDIRDGRYLKSAAVAFPVAFGGFMFWLHKKMMGKEPEKLGTLRKWGTRLLTGAATIFGLRMFADMYVPDKQSTVPDLVEFT